MTYCACISWYYNLYHTRKTCDNLKKYETNDISNEAGDFQLGIASTVFHFSSSTKDIKASLSLAPRYCRNSPFRTLWEEDNYN
jgi:hypothetical protein